MFTGHDLIGLCSDWKIREYAVFFFQCRCNFLLSLFANNKLNEKLLTTMFSLFHSELEKIGNSLNPLSSVTPNSIHLSIDPAIDKTPIYNQIIQAYKWSNKVLNELAS